VVAARSCVPGVPRSFQDTDGDGVGDLEGIRRRLDHLVDLGVDAVWISPIYPSPMVDFGYDVTDHTDIDPLFGTLGDFDRLLAACHDHGLRVVLDFVAGHTSDQHPWFVAARSSRDDPHRDWYVWADPGAGGGPPNNWVSEFGGSAWTFDDATGQYYLHIYLEAQPSLNWRHPPARGDARRAALLVRPRRRRLPHRCRRPHRAGRPAARQPARSGLDHGGSPTPMTVTGS
jgi:alpha-glucosidase